MSNAPEEYRITNIVSVRQQDAMFFFLFLMPLFSILHESSGLIWIPASFLFDVVVMTGDSCYSHSNPIFDLFGWHFYRGGTPENVTRILLSKQVLDSGNRTIIGIQVNDHVILDTGVIHRKVWSDIILSSLKHHGL